MEEGSMAPPARKTHLATNEDFRKLLETPRSERGGDETPARQPRTASDAKPRKRPPRPKPEAEKREQEGDGYRDRALERRKGFNPDYLADGDAAGELNSMSIEESKFLGGDVDHTHLVRGLDYALLQKTRGEMVRGEDSATTDPKSRLKAKQEQEVIKFKSAAGRAVFNAVFTRSKTAANDLFLPGRTAFVFELEAASSPDIPTTLRRSKADCPEVEESIRGGIDTAVLERMVKIMSYMRGSGSKPGKLRKKDRLRMLQMMEGVAAANGAARETRGEDAKTSGPVDADEDIFGEAGRDYVAEMPSSANGNANGNKQDVPDGAIPPPPPLPPTAAVGPARPGGSYDAATAAYAAYGDASGEIPPPPPPAAPPVAPQHYDAEDMKLDQLAGLAPPPPPTAQEAVPQGRKKEEAAEAIPRETEDAYEECYPDYGGFTGAVVDSDEEDLTHMDTKEGKSRYDFETEQQWERYKANKEMMPKAAFQFGVKMSDGRKGHKQLGKGVEQKEQKQLRKIQGMITKDGGGKYAKAFAEDVDQGSGSGFSKRRRI